MMKFVLAAASAAGALALAMGAPSAAQAATVCQNTDIDPNAVACAGFFDGNLLNNAHIDEQKTALASLGFDWDGNFDAVEKISGLGGSHTVDFDTLLTGVSYIAFHFGNGQGGPGQATAFYKIDAGAGLDQITLAYNASSDAVLYGTGNVPEPATWAMMILGFGGVGAAVRRRRAIPTAA